MDIALRNVIDDDLRVAQRALHRRFAAALVVPGAAEHFRAAGDIHELYPQIVKGSGLLRRRLESEDVDDFLLVEHALKVRLHIVHVFEDLTARRPRQEEQTGIRVDRRARLNIVLHAQALNIDRIQHDVRLLEVLRHMIEGALAGCIAESRVHVDVV